ncbi:hypothetical protein G7070_00255 [Propioniciclava coleopterorum]|uniref:Uncharacterized protein n=1 Tax=Propioniciclava coleopterorum TaxID=2714937 RepID=A0A6G7Y2S8_9ACTN|nr:hypothetical protein [Propioniciclava coleopterorum]QIK70996.1 hypothetical protein G7070_00255 [Propioniciclava coleopterorum]
MKLFSRKTKAPDAVVEATREHLGASGRILAWAATDTGHLVALPDRMLILRTGLPTEELGWHDVLHGGFSEGGEMRWTRMSTGEKDGAHLTDPQSFPEVFKERVESTFLLQQVVTPFPGRHVTISARRNLMNPAERVLWTAHPARGTAMDAETLAFAETELARLRAEYAF